MRRRTLLTRTLPDVDTIDTIAPRQYALCPLVKIRHRLNSHFLILQMGTLETDRDFMKFLATLESMQQKAEGDEGSGEAGKATNSILH